MSKGKVDKNSLLLAYDGLWIVLTNKMLKITRRISIQRYLYAMCRPAHRHTNETKAYRYNTMGTSGE